MKIAINATILDNKPTGLGIYTINLIREISKIIDNDDKLIVFTSQPNTFADYNVEIRRVSKCIQPKYGKKAAILRLLWTQFVFPIRLLKENVDLIYNTTHHSIFYAPKPQIITIHDLLPIKFPAQYRLQHIYFKFIIPILLNRCAAIITVSKNSKRDIFTFYNIPQKKVYVVYNSYDQNSFRFPITERNSSHHKPSDYILIIGASYPHKNIEPVLGAYSKIRNIINHKLLIVGGREEYLKILFKQVNTLHLDNFVNFLNYVPFNELPSLYSEASVLIFPSLYEGFGIPPLEAMACGCPVVVSNTSSLPEVCGNAAFYVNANSVESIRDGMYRVITDQKLRNTLIRKGFERVRTFSWGKCAFETLHILKLFAENKT